MLKAASNKGMLPHLNAISFPSAHPFLLLYSFFSEVSLSYPNGTALALSPPIRSSSLLPTRFPPCLILQPRISDKIKDGVCQKPGCVCLEKLLRIHWNEIRDLDPKIFSGSFQLGHSFAHLELYGLFCPASTGMFSRAFSGSFQSRGQTEMTLPTQTSKTGRVETAWAPALP